MKNENVAENMYDRIYVSAECDRAHDTYSRDYGDTKIVINYLATESDQDFQARVKKYEEELKEYNKWQKEHKKEIEECEQKRKDKEKHKKETAIKKLNKNIKKLQTELKKLSK